MDALVIDRGTVLIDLLLKSQRVAKTLAAVSDLPLDELFCLTTIYSKPPTCIKVLSRRLGVRGPRMSKLLGSLERKGFIIRSLNPVDHRKEELALTNEGVAAVTRLIQESGELLDSLFDAGEIDQMWRLIDRLEHARQLHPAHRPGTAMERQAFGLILPDEDE